MGPWLILVGGGMLLLELLLQGLEARTLLAEALLALQVLVENALKHAIAPRPEGGSLTLTARGVGRSRVLRYPPAIQALTHLRARTTWDG